MGSRGGIRIRDGIGPVLDYLFARGAMNVAEAMEEGKMEIEAYAKANAPWADRTGAARNGLVTSVYNDEGVITLELAHTVDYGVWLELIQNGRFATIMPTLEALGPKVIKDAGGKIMAVKGSF